MAEGRGFRAAEEDLQMPPFEDVRHAVKGMSDEKHKRMQATKRAGFKKLPTSRVPRIVLNVPGIDEEKGSRIPPPLATMTIAEHALKENVRHQKAGSRQRGYLHIAKTPRPDVRRCSSRSRTGVGPTPNP